MSSWGLRTSFAVLMGVFFIGFLLFGTVAYSMFESLRVKGPIYSSVVSGKDLVADILPPPAYIIEAELTVNELVLEANPIAQQALEKRITQLEKDFNDRIAFWDTQELPENIKELVKGDLQKTGKAFFVLVNQELLPNVKTQNSEKFSELLKQLKQNYLDHRRAVDKLVALVNRFNEEQEKSAVSHIYSARIWLIVIFLGSAGLGLVVTFFILRHLLRILGGEPDYAHQVVARLAQGDLETTIHVLKKEKNLLQSIKTMSDQFCDVVRGMDETNRIIGQSIFQITKISNDISEVSTDQQKESVRVSEATENLRALLQSVQTLTHSAHEKSQQVESLAKAGLKSVAAILSEMEQAVLHVDSTEDSVRSLADASGEINSIVSSIKNIADQTNLLALNAAIEAARAGEQGRGFAVVADEVRTLATRTSEATTQIQNIVDGLNKKVEQTLSTMTNVTTVVKGVQQRAQGNGDAIQKMAEEALASREISTQIAAASEQQVASLSVLDTQMHSLFSTMRTSSDTINLIHSISESLQNSVASLQKKTSFFRVSPLVKKEDHPNNQRKYHRSKHTLYVNVEVGGDCFSTLAKDFSVGGLLLATTKPMMVAKGDRIYLEIKPPVENMDSYLQHDFIRVVGQVVRMNSNEREYLYGVEFIEASSEIQKQLRDAVEFYRVAAE